MDAAKAKHLDLQLLFLISVNPGIDVTHLLTKQHATLPQFYESFCRLRDEKFIEVSEKDSTLSLTTAGQAKLPNQVQSEPAKGQFQSKCTDCEGRGFSSKTKSYRHERLKELAEALEGRPAALEEYDQWYMTPEHSSYRIDFLRASGDLVDKKLLFIGDDDMLSVSAAFTGLPREVVVLEIDQRIIDFVNKVAKQFDLKLKGYRYDIRVPLTPDFSKNFDVFFCDPTETMTALNLFLSRGVSCLKGVGSSVYFGLTALEASPKKWYDVQLLLHGMNLALTDIRHNFTEYPDPGWEQELPIWKNLKMKPTCPWYKSCLYRLEAIDTPKPAIEGDFEFTDDVYTDEESWATTSNKTEVDLSVNGAA